MNDITKKKIIHVGDVFSIEKEIEKCKDDDEEERISKYKILCQQGRMILCENMKTKVKSSFTMWELQNIVVWY